MKYRKKCGIRSAKKAPCDKNEDDEAYICVYCPLRNEIKKRSGRKHNTKKRANKNKEDVISSVGYSR